MFGNFWLALQSVRIWNNSTFSSQSAGISPSLLAPNCSDRVLDNVIASKNLPPEIAKSKIDNTNLFLRAMGLDAGMLS